MEKKQKPSQKSTGTKFIRRAATKEVLSSAPPPPKINPKWARHHRRLVELRDFFLRQKGTLAQDANEEQPTYSEHMADAGTDAYDRDFALSMLSADQNALYEIDSAIRRIETGAYGVCELTGKPIAAARLEAIPWARFSLDAEKQLEERGALDNSRAQLASRGIVKKEDTSGETSEDNEEE